MGYCAEQCERTTAEKKHTRFITIEYNIYSCLDRPQGNRHINNGAYSGVDPGFNEGRGGGGGGEGSNKRPPII